MHKKLVMLAVVILTVSISSAEDPHKTPKRFKSMKEATGQSNPPSGPVISEFSDGGVPMKIATSDGQRYVGGTPRVVIFRANTDAAGAAICHTAEAANSHNVQLFSEKFLPLMPDSSFLEVVWSGQLNVSSGALFQSALLTCSVSQGGVSVPCSGTEEIPVLAQASTTNGYSAWVTYHGYVEIDPNIETIVEIQLSAFSFIAGKANACGDTLTLKY